MQKPYCDIVNDLFPSYVDGLLSDSSIKIVEEHLENCEACRKRLESVINEADRNDENDREEIRFLKNRRRKNRQKIIAGVAISVLLIIAVFVLSHRVAYPIKPDGSNFEDHAGVELVGHYLYPVQLDVKDEIKVRNYRYVLYEMTNKLYFAKLEKDFTGWYRFASNDYTKLLYDDKEGLPYGEEAEPYFTVKLIGDNSERYLYLIGRNPELEIAKVEVIFDEYAYTFEIPEKEVFMLVQPIENSIAEQLMEDRYFNYSQEDQLVLEKYSDKIERFFGEWPIEDPVFKVTNGGGKDITEKYVEVEDHHYDVNEMMDNLEECLENYMESTLHMGDVQRVTLHDTLKYGRLGFALFQADGKTGIASMSEAKNRKYRITGIRIVPSEEVSISIEYKGDYFVVFGSCACPEDATTLLLTYDLIEYNTMPEPNQPEVQYVKQVLETELPEERNAGTCLVCIKAENDYAWSIPEVSYR